MPRTNYRAIVVAALAAFVASSVWYIAFGNLLAQMSPAFAGHLKEGASWRQPAVILQGLVLALVLARLVRAAGVTDWPGAARLAVWLWVGLVAVQWVGALMWEDTPWKIAAIHAGDWLVKLLIIAIIVGAWPTRGSESPSGVSPP
ncbi:MAG: DUF1761 domain-containing protein [Gemmatimonadales bacterium]